jgi:S1-C subfamily serine protease
MASQTPSRRPFHPQTNSLHWLFHILLILLVALLWRGRGTGWGGQSELYDRGATERDVVERGDLDPDEKATISTYRKAAPAVVFVTTLVVQRDMLNLDEFAVPRGSGSGIVWDKKGYIITNYHVIEQAQGARVTLADWSQPWDARLVGVAPDKDIAVLKIDAPEELLHPLDLGTSEGLERGQKVLAIGNPFGFDQTLTTGVISGLGREILSVTRRPIQGVIQTDAAINPGNSGGPLLDSAGRMIGMTTAIYSPSGASAGVGFAIPVDTVRRFVPQIIRTGKVERIGLGISIWEDPITAQLGLRGVLVRDVFEGSAARAAGLLPTRRDERGKVVLGDLIVAIDGRPVNGAVDLYRIIDQHRAGDTVTLRLRREGGNYEIQATLVTLE